MNRASASGSCGQNIREFAIRKLLTMKPFVLVTFPFVFGALSIPSASGKWSKSLVLHPVKPPSLDIQRKAAFTNVTPPKDRCVSTLQSSSVLFGIRGGGVLPVSPVQLATFYSGLYLFHSTVMQGNPNMMANFYGAVNQVKGSIDDLMYSSAANSQFGLGILIYLVAAKSQMPTNKAIGWSFLPYLVNILPIMSYAMKNISSINVNMLTIWSLLFGGSSFAILLDSSLSSTSTLWAKLASYVAFGVGLVGSRMPAAVHEKVVGANIDSSAQSKALFMGRAIILAMHGGYAGMLLHGVDPHKALGILTLFFVPIAVYVGFLSNGRKDMQVTNIVAWNGWIVSSSLVALGTLL